MPAMAIQICNTVMDVQSGTVTTTVAGIDISTLHNGQVGQDIGLFATGGFQGTLTVNQGNYGILSTFVNVNSATYGVGADLQFSDHQIFNVMSGNHTNNVEGYFYAEAAGNNGNVQMNLKSIGSMYSWHEATDPYSANPLQGTYIEKEVWTKQNGVLKTDLGLLVNTTGLATMSNSNTWGWTNGETGTSNTNYGGGTRNVSATGTGALTQYGYGTNNLTFNCNYTMPGGGTVGGGLWNFNNGISGTYSMSGN
jgi:hypothetical protein